MRFLLGLSIVRLSLPFSIVFFEHNSCILVGIFPFLPGGMDVHGLLQTLLRQTLSIFSKQTAPFNILSGLSSRTDHNEQRYPSFVDSCNIFAYGPTFLVPDWQNTFDCFSEIKNDLKPKMI